MQDKDKKIGIAITSFGAFDNSVYHNHLSILLDWKKRHNIEVYHAADNQQEASLNAITDNAINDGCEFILFLEHDNLYEKDLLDRLLKHDLDVVTGYYPFRNWPYAPIPLKKEKNGLLYRFEYSQGDPTKDNLMEMTVGCFGCCMIKVSVFKDLLSKGLVFRREFDKKTNATLTPDIVLFQDLAQQGYKIIVDGNARAGHLTKKMVVNPDNFKLFRMMVQLMTPEEVPLADRITPEKRLELVEFLLREENQI